MTDHVRTGIWCRTHERVLDDGSTCCEGTAESDVSFVPTDRGTVLIVDDSTGEIYGEEHPDQKFRVTDRDSAEWVLGKVLEARLEAAAAQQRLDTLKANLDAQIRQAERRADWLLVRFGGELEAFARSELACRSCKGDGCEACSHEGIGRRRTLPLDHGRLRFRRTSGRTIIHDHDEAALALGSDNEAVQVNRKVLVSRLDARDAQRLELKGLATLEPDSVAFKVDAGPK